VVEDDPNDVELLKRAFQGTAAEGRLEIVVDGDEAIEYLTATGRHGDGETHRWPALILIDLNLPRRKGHEVLRWIRWEAGVTQVPVVVLTSSDQPSDVQTAYGLGANSYLRKPARLSDLRALASTLSRYWLELNVGVTHSG